MTAQTQEREPYDFDAARVRMTALQQKMRAAKIPTVIVLEGWNAAGKGTMAGELLEGLDPRGYEVCVDERFGREEERYPFFRRYWKNMPKQGDVTIFIGSWYGRVGRELLEGDEEGVRRLEKARQMEEMLVCDGVLTLKFFLDISKKEQKRRLEKLAKNKETATLLSKADWKQNERYQEWKRVYEQMRAETERPGAEWHVLKNDDKAACKQALYETIIAAFEKALQERAAGERAWDAPELPGGEQAEKAPIQHLNLLEPDQELETDYKAALRRVKKKLGKLQREIYRRGIPVALAFEGWDAAGKGGAIRKLTSALDVRGFRVEPISSPTAEEKAHHHLWRFWTKLPARGEICIFDRTWYGRVMVERLEGYCTENQWKRAYEEMNLFEKDLRDEGVVLCKFWLQIDREEQLRRFEERQNNPEKQWKITEEDWRNREKWPQYEEAVDEMLQKTNTVYAPWTTTEANNKQYARIKVLQTVAHALEAALKEEKK